MSDGLIITTTKFWKCIVRMRDVKVWLWGYSPIASSSLCQLQFLMLLSIHYNFWVYASLNIPLALACNGRISGTYTQGMQFTEAL
jgi:hypothetical protein